MSFGKKLDKLSGFISIDNILHNPYHQLTCSMGISHFQTVPALHLEASQPQWICPAFHSHILVGQANCVRCLVDFFQAAGQT